MSKIFGWDIVVGMVDKEENKLGSNNVQKLNMLVYRIGVIVGIIILICHFAQLKTLRIGSKGLPRGKRALPMWRQKNVVNLPDCHGFR